MSAILVVNNAEREKLIASLIVENRTLKEEIIFKNGLIEKQLIEINKLNRCRRDVLDFINRKGEKL